MNIKRNIIVLDVCWTLILVLSLAWMLQSAREEQQRRALITARSIFKQVVVARSWNASHGGVYAPVTEHNQPNVYLDDPRRDLTIEDMTLTKINPAFMTRQMSEIAREGEGIQFRITSLNPLRPENRATPLETEFLQGFARGKLEQSVFVEEGGVMMLKYMAPLFTEASCLKCHEKQGYRQGDIRGGISVSLPFSLQLPMGVMALSHALIWLTGLAGMNFLGMKLAQSYNVIRSQAVMDALTGIANRRSFSERILAEFAISRKSEAELSVIMCDIDNFKKYNDRYGHLEGDRCLRRVAQCIQESLKRPVDFCARYGGEEFVVVLPNSTLDGAVTVAERIRENIINMKIEHVESTADGILTMSFGIATSKIVHAQSHEQLIQCADEALYAAKKMGRNKVYHFGMGKGGGV